MARAATYTRIRLRRASRTPAEVAGRYPSNAEQGALLTTQDGAGYTPEQRKRLGKIHERLVEARRELDALIGDAYLRPRANIVPVHFLDLSAAVEKLRWAEKEWRELEREVMESGSEETILHVIPAESGRT
ncbi:MAG: hypothetical protein M3391_01160 [Actinomycetota bacterium]|nr:hypothetical protein [Actinomycetota bacterium]